jgi:hypothetical protein
LIAAHFIGFFPAGFIVRGRQRLMAFTALGSRSDLIGRNSIGSAAGGASNDNLAGVVHRSPHIFLYNNASNLVVKAGGRMTEDR